MALKEARRPFGKGMMEWWNIGIMCEGALGRDERLLVQGTQTRAPPRGGIPSLPTIPTFPYSNIPVEVNESRASALQCPRG